MNEKELVEKIQSSDMNALGEIFEVYKNQAFKYSYLITGNRYTSEDIVQEAFIKCYTNIQSLKKAEQFKPWVFKILTRIAWKYSNKDKKAYPVEYKGVKVYYYAYKYKAVPDGYKVTEEEQKMIDDGSLQVGYGNPSSEPEEYNTQNVSWYEDGIEYLIMNWNYDDLTKDQMIDMAKEVIDK